MGSLIIYLIGATIVLGGITYASCKVVDTKEVEDILDRI